MERYVVVEDGGGKVVDLPEGLLLRLGERDGAVHLTLLAHVREVAAVLVEPQLEFHRRRHALRLLRHHLDVAARFLC